MPTNPKMYMNKQLTPVDKERMYKPLNDKLAAGVKARDAKLNAKVDADTAAKKAATAAIAAKTTTGYTNRAPGAMAKPAQKMFSRDKVAANKADVAMSKRSASPATPKSPPGGGLPSPRPKDLGSSAPTTSPRPPQKPMTSSPRPPQKPMTSSPRPPQKPMTSSLRPPQKPMTSNPRPPKKFEVGGTVNSRGNSGAVSGKKFSGTY